MARTVRDANLETRTARGRLAARKKPYWRKIDQGNHLGYYKGKRSGSWIARYFLGNGKYVEKKLGIADDVQDATGNGILSFAQAQAEARTWFAEQASGDAPSGPYTVDDALREYLTWYKARRKSLADVTYRANAFILPSFGEVEVSRLTTRMIRQWHEGLAASPARKRTAPGRGQQYRQRSDDPEAIRQRRASANKVLTILKAALNYAWRDGKAPSDDAWRKVEPFRDVDAPRIRHLSEDECIRLANACEPDFRKLVQGALLTGCRYGELISLRCGDFTPELGTIHIRTSKTGKARDIPLNEEGAVFFTQVTAGRSGEELAFLREDGEPWGHSHQGRRIEAAAKATNIRDVSFHILRHAYGAALAQQGVSMRVIADVLGHADTRITEKHYVHLAPSYVAETIRRHLPALGIVAKEHVVPLRR